MRLWEWRCRCILNTTVDGYKKNGGFDKLNHRFDYSLIYRKFRIPF
ncbi:hypothetical protein SAMN04487775_10612 [Treponema bryantii]|uniref:Uncharacterized protein n=1 Tax=Treponema bryantii TaxID=163 RepID=A0A1I3L3F9_9SPIR|nr:hypothetical protein SAMN04487775_10612 [Treponema bryantii]